MGGSHIKILSLAILAMLLTPANVWLALSETPESRVCTLALAAVSSSGEGVTGNLTVKVVKPGSGLIFVSTSPAVEVDVQGAARIAVLTASLVGNFNPLSYDYYFIVTAPAIVVGGPSAGAAMALAVLLAVEGARCDMDYVVTGMINPDTSIGPVGGLKEKLEASASRGAKVFIIPSGQSIYTYYERVIVRRGPLLLITTRPETVNLREYGEKLGVKVIEVTDLLNLYSIVTGAKLNYSTRSPTDSMRLRVVAEKFLGNVSSFIDELREQGIKGGFLDDAIRSLNQAREALEYGKSSYLALLKSIEAATLAQLALWTTRGFDLDVLYNDVNGLLERFTSEYEKVESVDLGVIEFKGLAYVHAWTAGMLLNTTYSNVKARGFATLEEALNLARALWEARVARVILAEAKPIGTPVNRESLELLSRYLVATSRGLVAYANQLFSEAGLGSPPQEATLMTVTASILRDPIASIFLSIKSMSIITQAIHERFGSKDVFDNITGLALNLAITSKSNLSQSLLKASLEEKSYLLLTESMLLSWVTTWALQSQEHLTTTKIPQPQVASIPLISEDRGANSNIEYGRVREVLEVTVGSVIKVLATTSIALALIAIITYVIYRRLGS